MGRLCSFVAVAAAAGLAGAAAAGPITLTIDPARSQITVTMTAQSVSDTDSSPVTGAFHVCVNDSASPSIALVQDLDATLTSDLHFVLDYGIFLGQITADSSNAAAAYGTPGTPTGPVAAGVGGLFTFAEPDAVPIAMSGTMSIVSSGIISGAIPSQTVDLSTFGNAPAEFAATVTNDGTTITVSGSATFSHTTDLGVVADGSLTVVATAPLPAGGCLCDFDCAAGVNVFDLLAYLDGWFVGSAAAEMTGDAPAAVDVFDLLAFLDCWFAASAGTC